MTEGGGWLGAAAGETEEERWQRNFHELLQELRVAQTGVQILFAFLLILAFSDRFGAADGFSRAVYLVALLAAAAATAMTIAPVAHHRILFRRGQKPRLVRDANRMALGGLVFLFVSMTASVLLVTDIILDRAVAVLVSVATAAWFAVFWVVPPLRRRRIGGDDDSARPIDPGAVRPDPSGPRPTGSARRTAAG